MNLCASPICDGATASAVDLLLCWRHRNLLQVDALDAVEVYDELASRIAHGAGRDYEPRVAVSRSPGLDLDDRLVDARHTIAAGIHAVMWKLLAAGVPVRPDRDGVSVRAAAQFIAGKASTLAKLECAGEASAMLHELANGEPYAAAYPDGGHVVRVLDGEECRVRDCPGGIRAVMRRSTSLSASVLVCDVDDTHRWFPHEWALLDVERDDLVDAAVAAAALGYSDAGAVYTLASRGILTRLDTGDGPRYRMSEVRELARQWHETV